MATKKTISKNLSKSTGLSLKDSTQIVEGFLKILKKNINNKEIKISGFGSFSHYKTSKRTGRNPMTGESYIIRPIKKLRFNVSYKVKKVLN